MTLSKAQIWHRFQKYYTVFPDLGTDRVLLRLAPDLGKTLLYCHFQVWRHQRNWQWDAGAKAAYHKMELDFAKHAVAITSGSELDESARKDGWLTCFPMWDWVGGRTSETSAVGSLPSALQGFKIDELLSGSKACDEITCCGASVFENPAAQFALMWFYIGNGRAEKDMVILPYKDRLELLSKYLQQLVMESLGKELNLNGLRVNQGLAVYGNKGSTDQHSYKQQLRDGINNFFVVFIEVLTDCGRPSLSVEPDVASGHYRAGFCMGTRQALHENGRESIGIAIDKVTPFAAGVLIALFERAVGLYELLHKRQRLPPTRRRGRKDSCGTVCEYVRV